MLSPDKETDRKLEALFAVFGKFLCRHLQSGAMAYHFDPADAVSSQRAQGLLGFGENKVSSRPQPAADSGQTALPGDEDVPDMIDEEDDYGLLETAQRKLADPAVEADAKLKILHALFRNMPRKSVGFLHRLIKDTEGLLKKQICSLLSQMTYPEMIELYRLFINDEDSSLRLTGIMGLIRLDSKEAKEVLLDKVEDPDPHIRRLIINFLEYRGDEAQATAIGRLANDTDETVSRVAIHKLGLMADHFAFVNLIPKLSHPNIKIRKEIIAALEHMSGTDLGFNYAASEADRKVQEQAWNDLLEQSYLNPRLVESLRARLKTIKKDRRKESEPQPSPASAPKPTGPAASLKRTISTRKGKSSESRKTKQRPKIKGKNYGHKKVLIRHR